MADMSVIVITPDNYETIRPLMNHLLAQTVRDCLEVVLVGPSLHQLQPDPGVRNRFSGFQMVNYPVGESETHARVAGIRAASAPVVALTEDHSFPQPGWARALIEAHRQSVAAVGPMMQNANPDSRVSRANLCIEYADWLGTRPTGMVSHLPGHNSSYKRDVLLAYGNELPRWLEAETVLHWDLGSKGHPLYLEPNAFVKHLNFSRLYPSLELRFYSGRQFAGRRADNWPVWQRVVYAVAAPLIPLVRLLRIFDVLKADAGTNGQGFSSFIAVVMLLLLFDAMGEMVGYIRGVGMAPQWITTIDFHRKRFLNAADRKKTLALGYLCG